MNKQNEILERTKLINEEGNLTNPGWCRHNLFEYNREDIKAPMWRAKEWDFYQVSDGEWVVQLNFANISIASFASADIFNLKTGEKHSCMGLGFFTKNKYQMPRNGEKPYVLDYLIGGAHIKYEVTETERKLYYKGISKGKDVEVNIVAQNNLNNESITIATPFKMPGRFFYTQKINCMPAKGTAIVGDLKVEFDKNAFLVLDWGRGVWPHDNFWYWGNGSTYIDGKLFGFEITWGIGEEDAATETCVFYDGKAHKIGAVDVDECPKTKGWMKPWVFKSDDGKFDLTMTPFYDNHTETKVLNLLKMSCHQVHGYYNGTVTLDDGTVLEIKDMYAFCEYVENLW